LITNKDIARASLSWPDYLKDEFEERSAIIEYDGKQTRANAELQAYLQIMKIERP
jgi:hypothetical protein